MQMVALVLLLVIADSIYKLAQRLFCQQQIIFALPEDPVCS